MLGANAFFSLRRREHKAPTADERKKKVSDQVNKQVYFQARI